MKIFCPGKNWNCILPFHINSPFLLCEYFTVSQVTITKYNGNCIINYYSIKKFITWTNIFPSTFLHLVNASKSSILNCVIKLNYFMCVCVCVCVCVYVCVCVCVCVEKHLKDFSFHCILLTFGFRYLTNTRKWKSCVYL